MNLVQSVSSFIYQKKPKNETLWVYVSAFLNEVPSKLRVRWDAKCPSYFVHVPYVFESSWAKPEGL